MTSDYAQLLLKGIIAANNFFRFDISLRDLCTFNSKSLYWSTQQNGTNLFFLFFFSCTSSIMYELFTFWEKKMLDGNFCHDLCIMVSNTQYDLQFLSIYSFFKCQPCRILGIEVLRTISKEYTVQYTDDIL